MAGGKERILKEIEESRHNGLACQPQQEGLNRSISEMSDTDIKADILRHLFQFSTSYRLVGRDIFKMNRIADQCPHIMQILRSMEIDDLINLKPDMSGDADSAFKYLSIVVLAKEFQSCIDYLKTLPTFLFPTLLLIEHLPRMRETETYTQHGFEQNNQYIFSILSYG